MFSPVPAFNPATTCAAYLRDAQPEPAEAQAIATLRRTFENVITYPAGIAAREDAPSADHAWALDRETLPEAARGLAFHELEG